jgi:uncharacterized damage-inducible protein DinB
MASTTGATSAIAPSSIPANDAYQSDCLPQEKFMTLALTLEELLAWNEEASNFWKAHLDANPLLLQLACGIGGATSVQEFVRHIWGVELRWAQRIAGQPALSREDTPTGPLDALFDLHLKAVEIMRGVIANPAQNWDATYNLDVDWIPPEARAVSYRKTTAHALFHSQRHWAQLTTLVRAAGFPSGFRGDLLLSSALR